MPKVFIQSCCFCVSPKAVIAVPHPPFGDAWRPTPLLNPFLGLRCMMMHYRWNASRPEWRPQSSTQWLIVDLCLLRFRVVRQQEGNETRWLWCHSSAWLGQVSGISQSRLPEGLEVERTFTTEWPRACSWWQVQKKNNLKCSTGEKDIDVLLASCSKPKESTSTVTQLKDWLQYKVQKKTTKRVWWRLGANGPCILVESKEPETLSVTSN